MTTSPKPASKTPTSSRGGGNTPKSGAAASGASSKPASAAAPSAATNTSAALALNMGWQLLVVSVVPLVGGHLFDTQLHTAPWFVIIGGVITLVGTIVIVAQTVRQLNAINGTPEQAAANAKAARKRTEDKK